MSDSSQSRPGEPPAGCAGAAARQFPIRVVAFDTAQLQLSHIHLPQRAHRRQTSFPRRPLRRAPFLRSFATCSGHASWQPLRPQLPLLRPPWPTSPPSNSIHPPPRLQTLQKENKGRKPCRSFSPGPRSQWCVSPRFSTRLANACCTCFRVVNSVLPRQKGLHWLQRPPSRSFSSPCHFCV